MRNARYPQWKGDGMEEMMAMPEDKMMPMDEFMAAPVAENVMAGPLEVLAHSYVPWQCYRQAFSPREALKKGTLFPELWGVYPIPK